MDFANNTSQAPDTQGMYPGGANFSVAQKNLPTEPISVPLEATKRPDTGLGPKLVTPPPQQKELSMSSLKQAFLDGYTAKEAFGMPAWASDLGKWFKNKLGPGAKPTRAPGTTAPPVTVRQTPSPDPENREGLNSMNGLKGMLADSASQPLGNAQVAKF